MSARPDVLLKGGLMSTSVNQYVAQRAELLAHLVLTRRKDIQLIALGERQDIGIDLLAQVSKPVMNGQVFPSFGVEVMGTSQPLEDEISATRYANQWWKHRQTKGLLLFPIVLLLFSMENDLGYSGWLMEPHVSEESGPSLTRVSPLCMTKLNKKRVDELVQRVEKWFEATAEILIKPVPAR